MAASRGSDVIEIASDTEHDAPNVSRNMLSGKHGRMPSVVPATERKKTSTMTMKEASTGFKRRMTGDADTGVPTGQHKRQKQRQIPDTLATVLSPVNANDRSSGIRKANANGKHAHHARKDGQQPIDLTQLESDTLAGSSSAEVFITKIQKRHASNGASDTANRAASTKSMHQTANRASSSHFSSTSKGKAPVLSHDASLLNWTQPAKAPTSSFQRTSADGSVERSALPPSLKDSSSHRGHPRTQDNCKTNSAKSPGDVVRTAESSLTSPRTDYSSLFGRESSVQNRNKAAIANGSLRMAGKSQQAHKDGSQVHRSQENLGAYVGTSHLTGANTKQSKASLVGEISSRHAPKLTRGPTSPSSSHHRHASKMSHEKRRRETDAIETEESTMPNLTKPRSPRNSTVDSALRRRQLQTRGERSTHEQKSMTSNSRTTDKLHGTASSSSTGRSDAPITSLSSTGNTERIKPRDGTSKHLSAMQTNRKENRSRETRSRDPSHSPSTDGVTKPSGRRNLGFDTEVTEQGGTVLKGFIPVKQLMKEFGKEHLLEPAVEASRHTNPERTTHAARERSERLPPCTTSAVIGRMSAMALSNSSPLTRVEHILGAYLDDFHSENEYWARTWLQQARHQRSEATPPADLTPRDEATSVFASMKPRQITLQDSTRMLGDCVDFKVENLSTNSRQVGRSWTVRCDVFSTDFDDLPKYKHYVSIRDNLLASSDRVLIHWPFVSENPPDDFESRLKEGYYDGKNERQRRLCRMLQSESIAEYIEDVLRDLEITWSDVLRFLLEPELPDVGNDLDAQNALEHRRNFCEEDFTRGAIRWNRFLSKLPTTTPGKLGLAALICEEFQRLTKIPLWHVARRSDYTKSVLEDDSSTSEGEEEDDDDDLTCRVCMRFNCPYHGEIYETNGDIGERERASDIEVVVTDIINPPQINRRQAVFFPDAGVADGASTTATAKARRQWAYWQQADFINRQPDERGPIYPCNHPGIPCKSVECSCWTNKVPCEKSCACSADCVRKYPGCACAQKSNCCKEEKCLCYRLDRECDPDVCGTCGVADVLNPFKRHSGQQIAGCGNASIQLGIPKHTVLGESSVHGLGLFACEDIEENEFVVEYQGEIIPRSEGERRGAMYEPLGLSYLFALNKDQDLDSTYFGNKARFINHADKAVTNLHPKVLQVNMVHHIGLFAKGRIRKGQELFFDYGEQFKWKSELEAKHAAKPAHKPKIVRNDYFDVEMVDDKPIHRPARKAIDKLTPIRQVLAARARAQQPPPGRSLKTGGVRGAKRNAWPEPSPSDGSGAVTDERVERLERAAILRGRRRRDVDMELGPAIVDDDDDDEEYVADAATDESDAASRQSDSDLPVTRPRAQRRKHGRHGKGRWA